MNQMADDLETWYAALVAQGLFIRSGTYDQDGHHAYYVQTFENHLMNQMADDLETWYAALVARPYQVCPNDSLIDLDLLQGSQIWSFRLLVWEKAKQVDFFILCCLWHRWQNEN